MPMQAEHDVAEEQEEPAEHCPAGTVVPEQEALIPEQKNPPPELQPLQFAHEAQVAHVVRGDPYAASPQELTDSVFAQFVT